MQSASFTGQIGYAWNASLFLFQGRRGGDRQTALASSITSLALNWPRQSATRWGGTVGVGWEYGFRTETGPQVLNTITFLWATRNNSFTATDPRLVGFLNDRISQDVDMVTLRINYRFGGYGAPVAARY